MALVDPRAGFFSEETQKITNWLPQWHAGRRLRTSNWAKVMNSMAGEALDDFRDQQNRAFRNLYLQTAHLDEPDIIRRADLLSTIDLNPIFNNTNILKNGGLALKSRVDKVGDYWSHVGTVEEATGLFGTRSTRLLPILDETSRIYQTISQTDAWGVGNSRTFSCWYKIPSWDGGTIPSSSHGLIVHVVYHDGSTETFRSAFSEHTNNQWRRSTLTVTANKTVNNYEVRLETARSASFNITAPVDVDGVQAQVGSSLSPWEPNILDKPFWFSSRRIFSVQVDTQEADVFITNSLRDFYYHAIPTRATLENTITTPSVENRGGGLETLVDFDRNQWLAEWKVDDTNNLIILEGLDPKDRYKAVNLSFFTGTDTGPKYEEGVSGLDYLCATKFGNWLYVIHEMLDTNGNNSVVLSVCDPRLTYPYPDYMEVIYSISIPLPTGADYHSIEFRYEDPQYMYIATSTQEFVMRLYYDYAMIDSRSFEMFTREDYTKLAVVK